MEGIELLESLSRLSGRHYRVCYIGKIASAGSMFGAALLFPFTYADELPFRALTLAIFTLSLVVLVALHLEPFVRVGPYTAPLALFILLLIVLPNGPSNTSDIKPWLPLYVVFFCSLTAIIHQFPFRITRNQSPLAAQLRGDLHSRQPSSNYPGYPTYRTSSDWSATRAPSQSYRNDVNSFQHMGPGSNRSLQTSSPGTEYTLRDLDGARRDPLSAFIYGNSHMEVGQHAPEDGPSRTNGDGTCEAAVDAELSDVRRSQESSQESQAPLLGSYN